MGDRGRCSGGRKTWCRGLQEGPALWQILSFGLRIKSDGIFAVQNGMLREVNRDVDVLPARFGRTGDTSDCAYRQQDYSRAPQTSSANWNIHRLIPLLDRSLLSGSSRRQKVRAGEHFYF